MPRPFVRKKFANQPAYASPIDRSHPIGRKVTAGFSGHYGPAIAPLELISGLPATRLAGEVVRFAGKVGNGLHPANTSSSFDWSPADLSRFCDGSQSFSIEWMFTYLSADAQFSRYLDCGSGAVTGGGWDIEAASTGGVLNWTAWNAGSAISQSLFAGGFVTDRTYHLVVVWDVNTFTPIVYVNGVLQTGYSAMQTITVPPTKSFFYSTYRPTGDLSGVGVATYFFRAYQGTLLTPVEVKRLYEHPFEMFLPPRKVLGNTVSGGGVTLALTGVQATSAVGSVGTGQLLTLGLTGVAATSSVGTVGVTAGGDKTFALAGVQAQTQTGIVGVQGADSTSRGGHFLPLTEKQLRQIRKRERKERRREEDRDAAKLADAQSIEAEIRALAFPAPVKPASSSVETEADDDDEDLELILLHS